MQRKCRNRVKVPCSVAVLVDTEGRTTGLATWDKPNTQHHTNQKTEEYVSIYDTTIKDSTNKLKVMKTIRLSESTAMKRQIKAGKQAVSLHKFRVPTAATVFSSDKSRQVYMAMSTPQSGWRKMTINMN